MTRLISPELPTGLLPLQLTGAPVVFGVALNTWNTAQCQDGNTQHMTLGRVETATKETPPNARSFGHSVSVDVPASELKPLAQRLWTLVVVGNYRCVTNTLARSPVPCQPLPRG